MQKSLHHSFDIHVAQEYGVQEAILIHHFQHWISINANQKKNFHEGNYWTYQKLDDIAANFPYLSKDAVVTLLEKLCTGKTRFQKGKSFEPVLKKGNFNSTKYERTTWYAFCDPTKWILWNHKMDIVDPQNGSCGTTNCIYKETDTKPDAKTDKKRGRAPAHPSDFPSKSVLRKEHVHTSDEEHTKLLEFMSEEERELCYKRLSDWKLDTPRSKWKKRDYNTILRWVWNAVQEDALRRKKTQGISSPQSVEATNRDLALKAAEVARSAGKDCIEVGYDYIELRAGYHCQQIKFNEHGFQERVKNQLSKWGVYLPITQA